MNSASVKSPSPFTSRRRNPSEGFGHYALEAAPAATRASLTEDIVDTVGWINGGKPNVLDEALQTAEGQLVYQRDRMPASANAARWAYSWFPEEEYPFAYDQLALRLEGPMRQALKDGTAFYPTLDPGAALPPECSVHGAGRPD